MPAINVIPGVPNTARGPVSTFMESEPIFPERNLRISGVTRDSSGNALGGVTVALFETDTNVIYDQQVSNASGNYVLQIPVGLSQTQTVNWKVVAYLTGSPDMAGSSVNTLTGS